MFFHTTSLSSSHTIVHLPFQSLKSVVGGRRKDKCHNMCISFIYYWNVCIVTDAGIKVWRGSISMIMSQCACHFDIVMFCGGCWWSPTSNFCKKNQFILKFWIFFVSHFLLSPSFSHTHIIVCNFSKIKALMKYIYIFFLLRQNYRFQLLNSKEAMDFFSLLD